MTKEEGTAPTTAPHPEEMRADVHLWMGDSVSLKVTARTTPAGLVMVGVLVSGIVLSVAVLVREARRRPR